MRANDSTAVPAGNIVSTGSRHTLVWIVLLALSLLALGLRLARLAFQPLWWDEGWSLYFATSGVGAMLERTAVDIHPPLYYLLLHFWIQIFGSSVLSVRLLSVLAGVVAVPLLYATGRRLLGTRGGLLAAFLLAISPFHVYYAQEVRMYGLVTLLGLAAFYFALRWESGSRGLGDWAGYVLAATAALYTQYYAAFLLLALNLVVLLRWLRPRSPEGRESLWHWLGAQVAVAILFLPWLWYAGDKLATYVRFKVGVEGDPSLGLLAYLGRHLATFTWGHAEGLLSGWWWLGLIPLLLLLVFLLLQRRGDGSWLWAAGRWPLIILLVTLACGFVVNALLPFNPPRLERLLLLALPAFLLLVAAWLVALHQNRRLLAVVSAAAFVLAAMVSLAFFYTVPRYPDDDYRPLIDRVQVLGLPADAVICVHPWQVGYFQAYIPDDAARPALFLTPREVIPRERQLWADEPVRMAADLDLLLAEHGRLWFPDHRAMGRVLERQIQAYLVEQAYPALSEWYGENTVLSFFATGKPVRQPVTAQFGGWLALESAAMSPGPLEAGWGVVAIDLQWQLAERPAEDYTVALRLVGPTGHIWAQRDAPPGDGQPFSEGALDEPRLDHHGLLVPAGTPPGDYTLTLQVYRSQDVAVLPVAFEGGSGGEVALGTVRIVRPMLPPPAEALGFSSQAEVDFAERLRLLGYTIDNQAIVVPGEERDVDLFWQALADPGEDFLPRLQLVDGNQVLLELTEKPVAGTYPTAWWRAGELVRDPHALPIPATVPPGHYRLALSLIRATDGTPVEFGRGQTVLNLDVVVEVLGREHNYQPTTPQHVQIASFGPSVELIGYDLNEATLTPGSSLAVTLHWHALETPDRNYHTFVHLLDAQGNIVAQHDGRPGNGELPTLGWLPGEYLLDPHLVQVPASLPAGAYRLGVGLYEPKTEVRLGERVVLDTPISVQSKR